MKKLILFAAIAFAAAVSCTREIAPEEKPITPSKKGYVEVILTAQLSDTKATLNGKKVVWEVGEKVAVFTPTATEPEEFTVASVDDHSVTISGLVPDASTSFIAAFPYKNVVSCIGDVVKMNVSDQVIEGSEIIDPDALASVAYFENSAATPTFKNAASLVSFSVAEEGITAVTLIPVTSGYFAGDVEVTVSADADPVIGAGTEAGINIFKDDGFTKDATYYAAIAPGAFEGLKVRMIKGGQFGGRTSTSSATVNRNQVLTLGDLTSGVAWKYGTITNAAEFEAFLSSASSYAADEEVKLANDIDLSGVTLTTATTFAGTFDGQDFSLKNWTSDGVSLFAENKGTVKDFTIDASCQLTLPAEITNFAFVVTSNLGTVSGIINNANITGTGVAFKGGRLGGIVGVSTASGNTEAFIIENCVNNGNVTITTDANTGGTQYIGTVVGSLGGSKLNQLIECVNNGNLSVTCSGTNTKNFYMGGVAGGTTNGSSNIRVKNTGDVSFICEGHEAALCLSGISSYTTGVTTDCENTGKITFQSNASLKATFVAGIAGYFASNTMTGCVNRGDVIVTAARINGRNGIGDINSKVYVSSNAITAGLSAGGLVSATGTNPVFADCENYGNVSVTLNNPSSSDGTHTAARPSVGGLVGDCSGPMTGCDNHGNVSVVLGNGTAFTPKNAGYTFYVGGIVGSGYNFNGATTSGGSDTNALNKFTLENCNNTGNLSYKTDNTHSTNNAIGGICGWPGTESSTTPYTAKNCNNSGDITYEGAGIKIRAGGIHGGTGRMNGCTNTGKITIISADPGSVAGSVAGFHSQAHTFSNCSAEGSVDVQCPINGLGGLVGNLGNVDFTGMDGCSVNCTLSGGPDGKTGLVVGLFNGNTKTVTLGSAEDPIEVYGSVNGTAVDATNFESLINGSTNYTAGVHTIYTNFKAPVFIEDLANNKFTYHGKEYPVVKLADGRWWMAAPMAYVPEGKTVSSDPVEDAGIWYTYTTDGTNTVARTDFNDGYLYDYPTAFGVAQDAITYGTRDEYKAGTNVGNFRSFEGTQGICPDGWYIPTRADFLKLVGASNKDDSLPENPETAAVEDATAVYWVAAYKGSNIPTFNDAGWNFSFLGCRSKTSTAQTGAYNKTATKESTCSVSEWVGKPALNQVMCSTPYMPNVAGNNVQYFCLMTAFTAANSLGKISLSYGNYLHGMEVRCIRKAD